MGYCEENVVSMQFDKCYYTHRRWRIMRRELRENHRTRSKATSQTNKFYYIWSYDNRVWVCRLFFPLKSWFEWAVHAHVRLCTTLNKPNTCACVQCTPLIGSNKIYF